MLSLLFNEALHGQATSRAEEITQERLDKRARAWPERTTSLVRILNRFTERGLFEAASSRKGTNGTQFVLGGMRQGQGAAFGVGYRRMDILEEWISYRVTARGTFSKAYMFDLDVESPRLRSERGDVRFYTKYENSPQMDYYGPGPDSSKDDRTSFRLEAFEVDVGGRYRVWRNLYAGGRVGAYFPNTGPGQRGGYPSTEEVFSPDVVPALGTQPNFVRYGGILQWDSRDLPSGPRSGGNYYARHLRYSDLNLDRYSFHELDAAVEHYVPYWNKTNVVALRLGAVMTWAGDGNAVPFFLQPTLGGNDYLRGFARFRFYDQNLILGTAEHRWHLFSGGYAALFFEMGKVSRKASQLNFHDLEYTGGLGFRFTWRNAVIMRIDNAVSREGYRFMWTFNDVW